MRVAVIPARGGSRRIPRKNVRDFHGKPIIAYSIKTAKQSGLFDAVIVSTDDMAIAQIASTFGCMIFIREKRLAADEIGTQEVMRDALGYINRVTEACCIYPTAPLMTAQDLREGLAILQTSGASYVYTVGPNANLDTEDAGQWYWGRTEAFLSGIPLEGNSRHYVLPAERCCDINEPSDWSKAEQMYRSLHGINHG